MVEFDKLITVQEIVGERGPQGPPGPKGENGKPYSLNINERLDKFANNWHLNNPVGTFMNDIQSGFFRNGVWHIYYLYNADFSWGGNGSEWYHVTTTDWVKFHNEGVAIPKYKTSWGDIASGTIWEDTQNTMGLGSKAIFAMATGYGGDKGQNTMLYISVDDGYTFKPFKDTPIMAHPANQEDFRDPYVFNINGKFIVYHAENNKFGVYTANRIDGPYTYVGSYNAPNPLLECPNLFDMNNNGNPNNKKWVLFYGGNEDKYGTGTYASVGHLNDNFVFVAEQENIRVDYGTDFYAAKPFKDGTYSDPNDHLLCFGWAGNWGYVGDVPKESRGGVGATSARRLTLTQTNGIYEIKTDMVGVFDYLSNPVIGYELNTGIDLPAFEGDSFYLKLKFKNVSEYKSLIYIKFTGNEYDATFSFDLNDNTCNVHRYNSSFTNNDNFSKDRKFPFRSTVDEDLWLEFFVDRSLIEFMSPMRSIYTMAKFPNGRSREKITVNSSFGLKFDYEYYQINNQMYN